MSLRVRKGHGPVNISPVRDGWRAKARTAVANRVVAMRSWIAHSCLPGAYRSLNFALRSARNCFRNNQWFQLGAPGRTRTSTMLPPPDFESGASTNSATGA
jgi:hypothetical protein